MEITWVTGYCHYSSHGHFCVWLWWRKQCDKQNLHGTHFASKKIQKTEMQERKKQIKFTCNRATKNTFAAVFLALGKYITYIWRLSGTVILRGGQVNYLGGVQSALLLKLIFVGKTQNVFWLLQHTQRSIIFLNCFPIIFCVRSYNNKNFICLVRVVFFILFLPLDPCRSGFPKSESQSPPFPTEI
jgi:hypothetical protein